MNVHPQFKKKTFHECKLQLTIQTFKSNLDRVNVNDHAKYLRQRPFCSEVTVHKHINTHIHTN